MSSKSQIPVIDRPQMRDKPAVFADRRAAGQVLAEMLEDYRDSSALVLGIPAGGVAVAAVIAGKLGLELHVAVVNKITPPWNSEWGFGAVAFDGSVVMNQLVLASLDMDEQTLAQCTERARAKVQRRLRLFGQDKPLARLADKEIILVDDGLATGITVRGAIEALSRSGAKKIILAVPTAHDSSISQMVLAGQVRAIYCPNIRSGFQFAVAEAYQRWQDLSEKDVLDILAQFAAQRKPH